VVDLWKPPAQVKGMKGGRKLSKGQKKSSSRGLEIKSPAATPTLLVAKAKGENRKEEGESQTWGDRGGAAER